MRADHEREYQEYVAGRLESLRRSAYLLCRDWHQADDLVQATAAKLFVSWSRARRADNLGGYVQTILVRVFLDARREKSRAALFAEVADRPAAHPDLDAGLDVRDALAGLTPGQRAVLVLRFYGDLTVDDAARVLGCSAGNVKSQTHRALAALRSALGAPAEPAATHQKAEKESL